MSTPVFTATEPSDSASGSEQLAIPGFVDPDLVEQLMSQAYIDAGHFTEEDGFFVASDKQLRFAAVELMLNEHVVKNGKEMSSKGVTKFELYAALLPDGPGVARIPQSAEEAEAKNKLMTKVWGLTNTGTSGYVQKNIAESGYVVVEAQVGRTKVHQETGKKEITTEMARFLTADHELIMTHLTGPAGAKFVAQARKLENLLGMVTERRPELTTQVARQLSVAVKQAVASVPHADTRQAAALTALTAGDGDTE